VRSAKRITGYDAEDFMSDPELGIRIIHPEDLKRFRIHMRKVERQSGRGEIALRILRRDGEVRWLSHARQPIFDNSGRYLGVRGSNRNITEHKE
jgi:PAS domain S-box-containing protein